MRCYQNIHTPGKKGYEETTGLLLYTHCSPIQTIFLPLIGLVDPETLKPGDIIGVNKDSYLILDTLPAE
jgi:26S proteasome regulatory subunit T5